MWKPFDDEGVVVKSNETPHRDQVHDSNEILTQAGQRWIQENTSFIGRNAAPTLNTAKKNGRMPATVRADFYRDEAEVRVGATEASGGGFGYEFVNYDNTTYAFKHDIPADTEANADEYANLQDDASAYISMKLLIKRERIMSETFFQSMTGTNANANQTYQGGWGTGADPDAYQRTLASDALFDADTSDPVQTIVEWSLEIAETGMMPNKLILGIEAFYACLENSNILDRLGLNAGATTSQPAQATMEALMRLFRVNSIYVLGAVYNSAGRGAAESLSFINSKGALLYYAPDTISGMMTPTAIMHTNWSGFIGQGEDGFRISQYPMRHLNDALRIEGEAAFGYLIRYPELGRMSTAVVS